MNPTPVPPPTTTSSTTAVVLGGSLAGLLAAAAIRQHVDRVIIADRDVLGPTAGRRPGTPHASQAHGLLPGGRAALERVVPGTIDDLFAVGGISYGDYGLVGRWWVGGGLLQPTRVDEVGLGVSRSAVETVVRRRVRATDGIELWDGVEAVGLTTTADRRHCTGARLRPARSRDDGTELAADLVIDATGRAGRAERWLADLGLRGPDQERVEVDLRYATAHVGRTPGDDAAGIGVHVSGATPTTPRGGVAIVQEDGSWVLTLFGYQGDHPPIDPDGWRAFARTIVSPNIADLADRPLLDRIRPFGFAASVRRRYDRLPAMPEGLVVVGDALASFDPAFGQGMSIAAMEAMAIGDGLARMPLGSGTRRLQRRIAGVAARAWHTQRLADMAIPGVAGPSARGDAYISAYIRAVQRAARHDPVVSAAFSRVTALLEPPASLFLPHIARRVWHPGRTVKASTDRHGWTQRSASPV